MPIWCVSGEGALLVKATKLLTGGSAREGRPAGCLPLHKGLPLAYLGQKHTLPVRLASTAHCLRSSPPGGGYDAHMMTGLLNWQEWNIGQRRLFIVAASALNSVLRGSQVQSYRLCC